MSKDNVLPTERGERFSARPWLVGSFPQEIRRSFVGQVEARCFSPLATEITLAIAKAHWDKQKTVGFVEDHSARFALVDQQKLTIPVGIEPTPLSGVRSQGAQWTPRGRIWRSWQVRAV